MIDGVFLDGLALTLFGVPQGEKDGFSYELGFIENLALELHGDLEVRSYGAKGYPKSAIIKGEKDGNEFTVFCCFGSMGLRQHMNIECKGFITEYFASLVLDSGVDWSLTRADIAMDMEVDFEVAHNICKVYAKSKSIATSLVGDWEQGINGRTYYIGKSRKESESYIRLYEKSIEMRQKGFIDYPDGIVRLELEYKPKKHKRQHITSLDARNILSTALNPLELFEDFLDEGIEPTRISAKKVKDYKVSFRHMISQYLNVLTEYKDNEGMVSMVEEIENAIKYGVPMY